MTISNESIWVHANLSVSADALEALVQNARKIVGPNEKGHYPVDTAALLGQMISQFLEAHQFTDYVRDIKNYPDKSKF